MVAKSFQSMTQLGDPYESAGKMYVQVRNEKTGTIRQVRWYTEKEYAAMYGKAASTATVTADSFGCQKKILGFEKGYITIFKGDTSAFDEWFQRSPARYCRWWGWYIISTQPIPIDLPVGIKPVQLPWEMVGEPSGALKPEHLVKAAVETLLYDRGNSAFAGAVGERLDLNITVIAAVKADSNYGITTIHTMQDADGNHYLWRTNAKSWEVGEQHHIKGTVKEHKVIKNVNTTILTRCALVK